MYLKKEKGITLDINELGFAKLKDLLLTIPNVKVELRGVNHPFAVYETAPKDVDRIVSILAQLVLEFPMGVAVGQLELYLYGRVGDVSWEVYRCDSFYDFIQRYAGGYFDVLRKTDGTVMLFSTEERAA